METQVKTQTEQAPALDQVPLAHDRFLAVVDQEEQLAANVKDTLADKLARLEDGLLFLQKRAETFDRAHLLAIRRTEPEHWVLFKDKQGNVNAMLTAPGAPLVAEVYGIQILNPRPLDEAGNFKPEKVTGEGQLYGYRAWADARSGLTGRYVQAIEAFRASNEDFTGRSAISSTPAIVRDADLRASVFTLLLTKAVRVLGNCTRVPPAMLARAWEGTGKSVDNCRHGSGFGSSSERQTQAITPEALKAEQVKLGNEILARVGGDTDAAKKLCLEITSNPDKDFRGFDSVARLAQDWQIANAWKRLKAHPVFGDQNGHAEGGR
jgi:hypothetical protein